MSATVTKELTPQVIAAELRLTLYLPNCPHCDGSDTVVTCTRGPIRHCHCRDCGWNFRVMSRPSQELAALLRRRDDRRAAVRM